MRTVLEDLECPDHEVSILFFNDAQIEEINKKYLGRTGPTNVISFSMAEGEFCEINPHILGDVVISVETAQRQALESRISCEEMIDFLLVHGILHLRGYDHEGENADADEMEEMERVLFEKIRKM